MGILSWLHNRSIQKRFDDFAEEQERLHGEERRRKDQEARNKWLKEGPCSRCGGTEDISSKDIGDGQGLRPLCWKCDPYRGILDPRAWPNYEMYPYKEQFHMTEEIFNRSKGITPPDDDPWSQIPKTIRILERVLAMPEPHKDAQLSDRERCLICLDRISTMGEGYVTQFPQESPEVWVYGRVATPHDEMYSRMNPMYANLLVDFGWIKKDYWEDQFTIWEVSPNGYKVLEHEDLD